MRYDPDNMRPEDVAPVARHLDGADEPLDGRQTELADEVRRVEAWAGSLLDVAVPQEVLDRAYRTLDDALAASGRRRRRFRLWTVAASAAAAAVIAVAILLSVLAPTGGGQTQIVGDREVVEEFLREETSTLDLQLAMLDDEVTLVLAELVLDDEFGDSSAIDAVAEDLGGFWFDDLSEPSDDSEL